MSLNSTVKISIDKNRFFLETIKFNKETLLKNFFSPFYRECMEINFKKKITSLTSPFFSSLILVFLKNSHDIFKSLIDTYFLFDISKKCIVENLILIGKFFLTIVKNTNLTGNSLNIYKKEKISKTFYQSTYSFKCKTKEKNNWVQLPFNIIFLFFVKSIFIEIYFIFLNFNFFAYQWLGNFIELFMKKKYKKKNRGFMVQNFLHFFFTCKNKKFVAWMPTLYENCKYQMVYWNLFKRINNKIKERENRLFLGSNLYFTNFELNLTGIENFKTLSQRHLTPVYYLTFSSTDRRLCEIERKKVCLDSLLVNFQCYLINKLEILEKRLRGIYSKFFFEFNTFLPQSFDYTPLNLKSWGKIIKYMSNLEISESESFSGIFIITIKEILLSYVDKTNNSLLLDFIHLLTRRAINGILKTNLFFLWIKLFKKKKRNFGRVKNFIGEALENFLDYSNENKKFRILTDYHLNFLFLNQIPIFKKIKWKLGYFYLDTYFYKLAILSIKDKVFKLFLLKLLFLPNNQGSIELISRKCYSKSNHIRRFSMRIIFARLTRNEKYYGFCKTLCSRFKSMANYSLGIALIEKKKFVNSKKQMFLSISLKSHNKNGWLILGFLSYKNRDIITSLNSFNKILVIETMNSYAKRKLEICLTNSIDFKFYNTKVLDNLVKNNHFSYLLIMKIYYYSLNKKCFNSLSIGKFIISLIELKTNKQKINLEFLKGIELFYWDYNQKKNQKLLLDKKLFLSLKYILNKKIQLHIFSFFWSFKLVVLQCLIAHLAIKKEVILRKINPCFLYFIWESYIKVKTQIHLLF